MMRAVRLGKPPALCHAQKPGWLRPGRSGRGAAATHGGGRNACHGSGAIPRRIIAHVSIASAGAAVGGSIPGATGLGQSPAGPCAAWTCRCSRRCCATPGFGRPAGRHAHTQSSHAECKKEQAQHQQSPTQVRCLLRLWLADTGDAMYNDLEISLGPERV